MYNCHLYCRWCSTVYMHTSIDAFGVIVFSMLFVLAFLSVFLCSFATCAYIQCRKKLLLADGGTHL